ncbi:MAG: hypothetical protein AB1486_08000 [Planctomycetota bacterium]
MMWVCGLSEVCDDMGVEEKPHALQASLVDAFAPVISEVVERRVALGRNVPHVLCGH